LQFDFILAENILSMEPTSNLPPEQTPTTSSNLKRNLITGVLIGITIVLYFSFKHFTSPAKEDEPKTEKKEPLFHRDEPVKEQIFQGDYEEKVREMLDSGKNVMEISRETGIRKDVIRKIKKGKDEEKKAAQ